MPAGRAVPLEEMSARGATEGTRSVRADGGPALLLLYALGALGLTGALAVAGVPALRFAYPAEGWGIVAAAAQASVAGLAAFLLILHWRGPQPVRLYASAAAVALALAAAFRLVARLSGEGYGWWATCAGTLAGATLLALAARSPEGRRVRHHVALVGLVVIVAILAVNLVASRPAPIEMSEIAPDLPHLDRQPGLLAIHLSCAMAFVVAAVCWARRSSAVRGEPAARWVAWASAAGATSALYLFLFPPVAGDWLHLGDLWRSAASLLLLVAAACWARDAAVATDRRRLAGELHDGVLQELACIRRHARGLRGADRAAGRRILDAAGRADDLARSVIDGPCPRRHRALDQAVRAEASRAAARESVSLVVDVPDGLDAPSGVCETVGAVVGEAVVNAARHGGAETVRIELRAGQRLRIRVTDDGVGFDTARALNGGGGLRMMSERVQEIGGRLDVTSRPGAGSAVEVEL
jgi:signal transduction histidine kinase